MRQDNAVLCGRGLSIAAHPVNKRFQTLATTRAVESYYESYSATENSAVFEEIVKREARRESKIAGTLLETRVTGTGVPWSQRAMGGAHPEGGHQEDMTCTVRLQLHG